MISWTISVLVCHFLWQGSLIWLVASQAARKTQSHKLRYSILCSSLWVAAICPLLTLLWTRDTVGASSGMVAEAPWRSAVTLAYAVGALGGLVHLVGSQIGLRRLITSSPQLPHWQAEAAMWCSRLGIRRVPAVLGCDMVVPAIAGVFKTCIFLPASLITRLDEDLIEAILVHELMHLKRNDILINCLQCIVERILFFHPAIWWISKQIRIEREILCDEEVLAVLSNRATYARALVAVEETKLTVSLSPAVAATNGGLKDRVLRILGQPGIEISKPSPRVAGFQAVLAIAALCFAQFFQPGEALAEKPIVPVTLRWQRTASLLTKTPQINLRFVEAKPAEKLRSTRSAKKPKVTSYTAVQNPEEFIFDSLEAVEQDLASDQASEETLTLQADLHGRSRATRVRDARNRNVIRTREPAKSRIIELDSSPFTTGPVLLEGEVMLELVQDGKSQTVLDKPVRGTISEIKGREFNLKLVPTVWKRDDVRNN